MERDTKAFRGKIVEKYDTVANFAKAVGWSPRKASYVSRGVQLLNASEMEEAAKALEVNDAAEFMRLFFPEQSIRWTVKGGAEQ